MWFYALIVLLIVGSGGWLILLKLRKRQSAMEANRRELDMALMQLSQELKKNPNNAAALAKRGIIRQKKGDSKGAMADLKRALEIDPSNIEARYHYGNMLYAASQFSQAAREYDWIMSHSEDPFYKTAVRNRLNELRAKKYW